MKPEIEIILAQPRGVCAGVERAIDIVELALKKYGAPLYVRHEIVHNQYVVGYFRDKGVIFVDELEEVPPGAVTIFSAHGVSEAVESEAAKQDLVVIDATCPLVTKVHLEAQRHEREGKQIILIGHKGHAEVEGTSGRVKNPVLLVQSVEDVATLEVNDPEQLAYVTQTTLSVDDTRDIIKALVERFPTIVGPDTRDICYATQNRQTAVKLLAEQVDIVLVIGSQNSSNSNRLRDLAASMGKPAYLVNGGHEVDITWFEGAARIGITAGASAPDVLVRDMIHFLEQHFTVSIRTMEGVTENIKFKLPKVLQEVATAA